MTDLITEGRKLQESFKKKMTETEEAAPLNEEGIFSKLKNKWKGKTETPPRICKKDNIPM